MKTKELNISYEIVDYDVYGTKRSSIWMRVEGECVSIYTFETRNQAEDFVNGKNK